MWCKHFNNQRRLVLACIVLTAVAGVWAWCLTDGDAFDSAALRDTSDIQVTVLATTIDRGQCRIRCRVTNLGSRTAERVVLTARLVDQHGRPLAMNPLADVADIQPGSDKAIVIPLPVPDDARPYTAEVESALVRWAQAGE
ncbi:MAG: hypothetical protein IT445_17240 [Phycisphaeraceae bacterium]|nr:hypothetical protein [Phycisphaeraceae bacterium]